MSDSDENDTPFQLPSSHPGETRETFGERLRRRREELSEEDEGPAPGSWQSRTRHLVAMVVGSPHDSASIARKNADAARAVDGVVHVLFGEDLPPFQNSAGRDFSGEPLLAEDQVVYRDQPVALVIGVDEAACRHAAEKLEIEYHASPGILTVEHAVAMESFHGDPRICGRGDVAATLESAPKRRKGSLAIAPQHAGIPGGEEITVRPLLEREGLSVHARGLLPTAVRTAVARAADVPESEVRLHPDAPAGTTGAMEMEPVRLAALATHAAIKCGSAVTLRIHSPHSPLVNGSRHHAEVRFDVGFEEDGVISAVDVQLTLDGGWFEADSSTTMDRALLHADSVYGIPHLRIAARLCRTNRLTAAVLPAEGAAQGAWAMEEIIQRVAEETGLPPHQVREKNFYLESGQLKTAPYGQPVDGASISRVWLQALRRSDYESRLAAVDAWNRKNSSYKRGIAIVPARFGVGDPRSERNAASVIVQILADGSVVVRAGVVDVGDGLERQLREEVAAHLGVEPHSVEVVLGDFDSLPRAAPVLGADAAGLLLRAIDDACRPLRERLREVALQLFAARGQTEIELEGIRFADGLVGPDVSPAAPLHFKEVIEGAWRKRVNLVATGYHRTPNLWWDPELGAGWPFSAFTHAAAVVEIQVDAFTGEIQILRVDVAHEGSPSPDQGDRDLAQLMRAFTMGAGWILSESAPAADSDHPEDWPVEEGIPGFADAPFQVVTDRLRPAAEPLQAPGDPCAEAPVLLAWAAREALWDALRAFGFEAELDIDLPLPATPPRVLATCKEISRQLRERENPAAGKRTRAVTPRRS